MNIYIRYFDDEALCHNMGEMQEYLESISEITVTQKMLDDIYAYAESNVLFPKRYKVNSRNYFIMIKTQLNTLAEFHANAREKSDDAPVRSNESNSPLDEERQGWYRCKKTFHRMIPADVEGRKMEYVESSIEALVRGDSPRKCHDRLVEYLQQHPEVDARSQFGAPRESNFQYEYKGELAN